MQGRGEWWEASSWPANASSSLAQVGQGGKLIGPRAKLRAWSTPPFDWHSLVTFCSLDNPNMKRSHCAKRSGHRHQEAGGTSTPITQTIAPNICAAQMNNPVP